MEGYKMEAATGQGFHNQKVHLNGHSNMDLCESSTDLFDGKDEENSNSILKTSIPRAGVHVNDIKNPVFVAELVSITPKTDKEYYTIAEFQSRERINVSNGHLPQGTVSATVNGTYPLQDLSLKKKVSFSENVLYKTDQNSDIGIDVLKPEPEPKPDYDTNNNSGEARAFTQGHQNKSEPPLENSQTFASAGGIRVDEYELRNRRILQGDGRSQGLPGLSLAQQSHPPHKNHYEMRFGMCVAITLVIVAIIGLAVLGTLYGITYVIFVINHYFVYSNNVFHLLFFKW